MDQQEDATKTEGMFKTVIPDSSKSNSQKTVQEEDLKNDILRKERRFKQSMRRLVKIVGRAFLNPGELSK
jgi:hypothetical protein